MEKSLTVEEFCEMHQISVSMFYKLCREGRGPRVMKVNSKTLISAQANREWIEVMEAANRKGGNDGK